MSDAYLGEIRMFGGTFAPVGWMSCNGQLLPISEYDALFNLLGTTYGGDGQSTFALPNLQSRMPVHIGTGGGASYTLGQVGGAENVQITTQQLPAHTHSVGAVTSTPANATSPAGASAAPSSAQQYSVTPTATMKPGAIGPVGTAGPHPNLPPYQALMFIIAVEGIYPSPQ